MKKLSVTEYATLLYELLKDAHGAKFRERILSFRSFLIRSRTEALTPRILIEFERIAASREGIVRMRTVSRAGLPDKHKKIIAEKFGAKKLETEDRIDPDVIGGIRLEYEDMVLDGTVSAMLKNLKSKLSGNG